MFVCPSRSYSVRWFCFRFVSGRLPRATLLLSRVQLCRPCHPAERFAGAGAGDLHRQLASSGGGAAILDGLRDIRSNVQNTITSFSISGYSGMPTPSISSAFPSSNSATSRTRTAGAVAPVNYAKESASSAVATYGTNPGGVGVAPDGSRIVGAVPSATTAGGNSGELVVTSGGGSFNSECAQHQRGLHESRQHGDPGHGTLL